MPRVGTTLSRRDRLGTLRARIGWRRNQYRVIPGLYCVGRPTPESPVLVTAGYKLSFDALRRELASVNAWILVVDTRGINVWCAAGKRTFSNEEIAYQVKRARLSERVSHRRLVLPQLAAPGVAAHLLPEACGFHGHFGPIRAADIPAWLAAGNRADEAMRTVTFTLAERLVLVPVELSLIIRVFLLICLGIVAVSGIGPGDYSLSAAWERGLKGIAASALAIGAGAVFTPAFLPWLPFRQFWAKGMVAGLAAGIFFWNGAGPMNDRLALWLWTAVAASFMAMNFTGATPFTSLSGVTWEMRRGLPVQIIGSLVALVLWLAAPF